MRVFQWLEFTPIEDFRHETFALPPVNIDRGPGRFETICYKKALQSAAIHAEATVKRCFFTDRVLAVAHAL
jgi:hypothetical protein